MLQWLSDNAATLVVGAGLAGLLGVIAWRLVRARRQGGGCCDCAGCPSAGSCCRAKGRD